MANLQARSATEDRRTRAELMRTLTEVFAPGAPSLPEGLRTLVVSPDRTVEPGTTVRATFAFYNFGGAAATGLRVRLALPDGLRYVPGSARVDDRALDDIRGETSLLGPNGADVREVAIDERAGDPFGFGNATIAATSLAAGATLVVEYRARIDSPLDDNTRIVLGGAVASSETAEFELARAELTVRSASRFDSDATRLIVDAPNEVEPGRRVRVALIADNAGTCAAEDVRVRLNLPDGLRYAPGSRAVDGRSAGETETPGAFVFPRIDAGRRVEAAIDAYVVSPAVDATPLPVTGSLQWATGSRTFERTLTVRSSPRFLESRNALTLDGPAQVSPAGDVKATIRIANDGTAQATGVKIAIEVDPAPARCR